MSQAQSRAWTEADASSKAAAYQKVLKAVLVVEGAAALLLLIWPAGLAALLHLDAAGGTQLVRLWAATWLGLTAFGAGGLAHPAESRLSNLTGIAARVLLLAIGVAVGAALPALWFGLAALVLYLTYRAALRAALMSRP